MLRQERHSDEKNGKILLVHCSLETVVQFIKGGVEDTRLETKAKDTKKIQGQGQPFRGKTLSKPMTGMFEAKDQGHFRKCSKKKNFLAISKKGSSKKFLLVLELRSRGFCFQAFADNLAVLVTGADMLWVRGMAQKAIKTAANWASKQELQFSSKKTKIVPFIHSLKTEFKFGFFVNEWLKS